MTEKEDRQLAEKLAELTRWGGEPSQLWRQALNSSATRPQRSFLRRFVSTPVPAIAAAGVIVVGIRHYRRQFLLERAVTEPIPAS